MIMFISSYTPNFGSFKCAFSDTVFDEPNPIDLTFLWRSQRFKTKSIDRFVTRCVVLFNQSFEIKICIYKCWSLCKSLYKGCRLKCTCRWAHQKNLKNVPSYYCTFRRLLHFTTHMKWMSSVSVKMYVRRKGEGEKRESCTIMKRVRNIWNQLSVGYSCNSMRAGERFIFWASISPLQIPWCVSHWRGPIEQSVWTSRHSLLFVFFISAITCLPVSIIDSLWEACLVTVHQRHLFDIQLH